MARFLITGSSGFIGGHLVRLARQQGHEVVATVRPTSDVSRINSSGAQLAPVNFSDPKKLETQLADLGAFDFIIHNAGVTKALAKEHYFEVNQGVTARLIEALIEKNLVPEQFVFVSSLAAVGAAAPSFDRVYTNQTAMPLTNYGKSKLAAEAWIQENAANFPWVFARPTAVYGPADKDILQFISMVNKGLEITAGSGEQKLSFIYGPDAAQAMISLAQTPNARNQKYFLSDGKDYTSSDLSTAVRAAVGKKRTLKFQLPVAIIKPVAALVEQIGRMQGKPTALNLDKVAELSATNWLCDSQALFAQTNFKPEHDLFTGMLATVEWYRKHGWLQ